MASHRSGVHVKTFRTIAVSALLACSVSAQRPVGNIKSKKPEERIAAIERLTEAGDGTAEKLLIQALKDRDWEVREKALHALGSLGTRAAIKPIVDCLLKAEATRVRRTAALALAKIDGAAAAKMLQRKAAGKTTIHACRALAVIYQKMQQDVALPRRMLKLMKHKKADVRETSALVWFASTGKRKQALESLLNQDIAFACAALDMIRQAPRRSDLEILTEQLQGRRQNPVVERRLRWAAVAACRADPDGGKAAAALLEAVDGSELLRVRRARLIPLLRNAELLGKDDAVRSLAICLEAGSVDARAAAAKALRQIGGDGALQLALGRFDQERDRRVRLQLLDTIAQLRGVGEAAHADWVAARLGDADASVRERAAVILGRAELEATVGALIKALADPDWGVAACAAVSLGKTRSDRAIQPLIELAKHEDWKLRGAAVVGLMHLNRREAVAPLLAALADRTTVVARAAHEGLKRLAYLPEMKQDPKAWRAWWSERLEHHAFLDRKKEEEKRKKYGYAVSDREIYEGLDVVVVVSRGDHIEELLDDLKIRHRKTQSSKIARAGVHPEAICVVNCTGEIEDYDIEPLSWFVRTGGFLFCSCWALHYTIERIYPGVLKKFETPRGEVLDDVRAYPCAESSYLNGVFPDGVRPIYHLEGAHLIEVVDPERAEVLIDSPDAAERHGSGELAAWFVAGHGVILDSANHFDLQGLEKADGLSTPAERQAYAMDHMGLTYARWREIKGKKFWSSSPRAARHVPDLSAFRFLTNFVRAKRIGTGTHSGTGH